MLWQKAVIAILTPTIVTAVSDAYDWVCEQLGCEDEPVKPKRKSPDNTKFDSEYITVIRKKHTQYLSGKSKYKNTQELANALNRIFGVNKSRSTYAKIWNNKK